MTTRTKLTAKDGTQLQGELAEPSSAKAPALIVLQEWHGVNDVMRTLVDRFAKEGFLAFAPDLYHGKVTKDDGEAGKLMTALDKPKALAEIGDAVDFVRSHARSNGTVAVTGFCFGGAMSFAAAASIPRLSAVVPFYGLPPMKLDWSKVTAPIQAHFAKKDEWATVSGAEEIKREIEKAGKTTMELHVYDAGHAFMREGDASKYDEKSAKVAWERAIAFLRKHTA